MRSVKYVPFFDLLKNNSEKTLRSNCNNYKNAAPPALIVRHGSLIKRLVRIGDADSEMGLSARLSQMSSWGGSGCPDGVEHYTH